MAAAAASSAPRRSPCTAWWSAPTPASASRRPRPRMWCRAWAVSWTPPAWSPALDRWADVLTAVLLAGAAYAGALLVHGSWSLGTRAPLLQWPLWAVQLAMAAGPACRQRCVMPASPPGPICARRRGSPGSERHLDRPAAGGVDRADARAAPAADRDGTGRVGAGAPALGPGAAGVHGRGHVERARPRPDPVDPDVPAVRPGDDARQHRTAADRHPARAHAARAGRAGRGRDPELRAGRVDLRLVDRHHARRRLGDGAGAAAGRVRTPLRPGRSDERRHAGHHHPSVDPDDPLRRGDGDLGGRSLQCRRRPRAAADGRVHGLCAVAPPQGADATLQLARTPAGAARRHLGAAHGP